MDDVLLPYVRLINCRFHVFRSSASSFIYQYILLFLKSSVFQWHHEEDKLFLESIQSNWLFYEGYWVNYTWEFPNIWSVYYKNFIIVEYYKIMIPQVFSKIFGDFDMFIKCLLNTSSFFQSNGRRYF